MLTKGIIVDGKYNDKTGTIQITLPEIYPNGEKFDAIIYMPQGISQEYKGGDPVIVGFLNHNVGLPVIIGKFIKGVNDKISVTALDVIIDTGDEPYSIVDAVEDIKKKQSDVTEEALEVLSSNGSDGRIIPESALPTVRTLSPNVGLPKGAGEPYIHKIKDVITIHSVQGNQTTADSLANTFKNPERKASCNYGIGYDGSIALICKENERSWCSSQVENDNRAITIEVSTQSSSPYNIYKEAYVALINLLLDICTRHRYFNGLYCPQTPGTSLYRKQYDYRWQQSAAVDNFINSAQSGLEQKMILTLHRWFADTDCPGNALFKKIYTTKELEFIVNQFLIQSVSKITNFTDLQQRVNAFPSDVKSHINLNEGFVN